MMLLVCLLLIFPRILIILDALQCKRPVKEAMDDLVGLFPWNDVDLMLRVVKHVDGMDSGKSWEVAVTIIMMKAARVAWKMR